MSVSSVQLHQLPAGDEVRFTPALAILCDLAQHLGQLRTYDQLHAAYGAGDPLAGRRWTSTARRLSVHAVMVRYLIAGTGLVLVNVRARGYRLERAATQEGSSGGVETQVNRRAGQETGQVPDRQSPAEPQGSPLSVRP